MRVEKKLCYGNDRSARLPFRNKTMTIGTFNSCKVDYVVRVEAISDIVI